MSKETKELKLGTLKLSDKEKQAIAEFIQTPGFRVWKKKIMPARELVIAGLALNAQDVNGLFYAKGMSLENSRQISSLEEIAKKYNANQLNEDFEDEV